MRNVYLLVYSETLGSREDVKKCINQIPEVLTWRYDLPNAFYLVSEQDAKTVANAITKCMGKHGRFILTEVSDNRWGWLPNDTWHLLKNKKLKPKNEKSKS